MGLELAGVVLEMDMIQGESGNAPEVLNLILTITSRFVRLLTLV